MIKVQWEDLPETKTPFLSHCRALKSKVDKDEISEAYRGNILSLTGNIHQCAELTVKEDRHVGPQFVKYREVDFGSLLPKNKKS